MAAIKTECPITREQFHAEAPRTLEVEIPGVREPIDAKRREFSTGTLGWYASEKRDIEIAGEKVSCQVQVQVMVVNSKELPK